MQEAELAWVRGLVAELDDGSFPDLAAWGHWVKTGELTADLDPRLATAIAESAPGASPATGVGEEPLN
jgi:hypothetical protein